MQIQLKKIKTNNEGRIKINKSHYLLYACRSTCRLSSNGCESNLLTLFSSIHFACKKIILQNSP